ncbi:MAG TPA: transporter substrate-binding domain-containing protein [Anaerolineales bacterium]|nr:transporter substrate-binding domain-containing protein [Anaerolineales bacterium]
MKHILLVLTVLALAACAPSVPDRAATEPADKLDEILARGTLVIATDPEYLPQSRLIPDSRPSDETRCNPTQYTANQFEGFDVDAAREVARRLGVEPCYVTPPWSQLVAGKWGDNWDVHVGSVAITFERMENLYFTQPYYATPTVLLVHEDNTSYTYPEDLSGKRIGVCAGCTFEDYLRGTLKIPGQTLQYRIRDARPIAFESEDPAIRSLSQGDGVELDAVMTILPKARAAVDAGYPVRLLDEPVLFAYASMTVDRASHRNMQRLIREINRIVLEMHADGTLTELSLLYQGMDLTKEAALYDIGALNQSP